MVVTALFLRWNTPRSRASSTSTAAKNPPHISGDPTETKPSKPSAYPCRKLRDTTGREDLAVEPRDGDVLDLDLELARLGLRAVDEIRERARELDVRAGWEAVTDLLRRV